MVLTAAQQKRTWKVCTLLACIATCAGLWACQGYAFDLRLPQRVAGKQLDQNVATPIPADILFVIDNSGSMLNQRRELIANMGAFIAQMAQSDNDFHLGIVTTDVECNLPERDCSLPNPNVSGACCSLVQNGNLAACEDVDTDGDGLVDWSNCDGGRLRAPRGQPSYFRRPQGNPNAWIEAVAETISALGCNGSGYESGLEAARRAVACAQNSADCPSIAAAQRNAGFLRPEADLVVIFVTDEDDCSFLNPNAYLPPSDPNDLAQQATHLCAPAECYAYYGAHLDEDGDGLQDWADPKYYRLDGNNPPFTCSNASTPIGQPYDRKINPPSPDALDPYLDFLVTAKGGDVGRVRAAGIVSSVSDANQPLGFRADACVNLGINSGGGTGLGVTNACGCWSASVVSNTLGSHNPYCAVTDSIGGLPGPTPVNVVSNECSSTGTGAPGGNDPNNVSPPQPGCKAMPAGRYVDFLQRLSSRRTAAQYASNTLIDSICNATYGETFYEIVNTVILADCFNLGVTPQAADGIDVRLNGKTLQGVAVGDASPGWSWRPGSSQVCLEGGLHKKLGDQFAIFVLQPS